MFIKTLSVSAIFVIVLFIGLPGTASVVLEDFEAGNLNAWTATGGSTNGTITPDAAHDGTNGVAFSGVAGAWYYRNDIVTAPGNAYRAFVYTTTLGSRFYIGVDAGPNGAIGAAFAPNSDTVELNDFRDYDVVDPLASDPYNIGGAKWYQLELAWISRGKMAARLYNEDGTQLLADTGITDVPVLNQNGLMFRGFTGTVFQIRADTISSAPIPEPGSVALLGIAGAVVLRRRRPHD